MPSVDGHTDQPISKTAPISSSCPPLELLRLSDAELRDYCARLDAAKGKANGSAAAPAVAEVVETGPR
jgi:hypothetical protein